MTSITQSLLSRTKIAAVVVAAALASLLVPTVAFADIPAGEPTTLNSVTPDNVTLTVGETVNLTATINSAPTSSHGLEFYCKALNASSLECVKLSTFESYAIGETSKTTTLTGKKAGTETINFILNWYSQEDTGATKSVTVTVLPAPTITSINPDPITLTKGDSKSVTVTFDKALPTGFTVAAVSGSNVTFSTATIAADRKSATFDVTGLETIDNDSFTVRIYNAGGTADKNVVSSQQVSYVVTSDNANTPIAATGDNTPFVVGGVTLVVAAAGLVIASRKLGRKEF